MNRRRAVQLATLTARSMIPATYSGRDFVEVGGLMAAGQHCNHWVFARL